MQRRGLGSSGFEISTIGLGTWAIGGHMWGGQDDGQSVAAVHAAIEHGINWIDTAPIYGSGRSEEVVGKAASRPLPPQIPIKLTALRRPFVVRKGDRVMIEAKMGGLSIQTAGVTKGNGELGQTVTVSNTDSGKDVRGKVVGPGVVRVDF